MNIDPTMAWTAASGSMFGRTSPRSAALLQHRHHLVSAGSENPLPDQFQQFGVPALLHQNGVHHPEDAGQNAVGLGHHPGQVGSGGSPYPEEAVRIECLMVLNAATTISSFEAYLR